MGSDEPPRSDPPAAPDDAKVIDMRGPPPAEQRRPINRPFRWRLLVGIVLLLAGGGVGYVIGDHHGGGDTPLPPAGRTGTPAVSALTSTGLTCSMQQGTALSIGLQLINRTGHPVNLDEVVVELPPGSRFHLVASFWGPCGTNNVSAQPRAAVVPANATIWVSAKVVTRVACAIPDPVVFVIGYDGGHTLRAHFNDLADGRYTGCAQSTD